MFNIYVVMINSDLVEGRGPMRPYEYFSKEDDAVACAKVAPSPMGGGGGEVWEIDVLESFVNRRQISNSQDSLLSRHNVIWGYRKDYTGRYGYGYIDNRDAPKNDPEFAEYLRLQKKFGGI